MFTWGVLREGAEPKFSKRPAPFPGPRCATHNRAKRRASAARNHDRMVQRTYGLEPGEYEALLAFQGGRCAACLRATGQSKRLAVDHNHEDGSVRGILCGPCNQILGHGRDDPQYFERIINYLMSPPYSQMRRLRILRTES